MLTIDGSQGEGGGQILRTSLALSLVTGTPFRIVNIRAGRKKPGLLRQHLTAVEAAAEVGRAKITGADIGSQEVTFTPTVASDPRVGRSGDIRPGDYRFAVGTAGSTTLVLQTVLPALLTAAGGAQSVLTLEGGTHNPHAPPFDFLAKSFLPIINRMGPTVEACLMRPGFYPAGGGKLVVTIEPVAKLNGLELLDRGKIVRRRATAIVSKVPRHIAERELAVVEKKLGWDRNWLTVEEVTSSPGPGNVLTLEIESELLTEVFTGFGERGVSAETVANRTAQAARRYLKSEVPVGEHLADQLLLPLALAGGGSFRTLAPSHHLLTNVEVIERFLDVRITMRQDNEDAWLVELSAG